MFLFTILIFILVSVSCYDVKPQINVDASIDSYIFEDIINGTIEGLRPNIPDPIFIPALNLTFPSGEDDIITGSFSLVNLNLTGLQGFQLRALNFDLKGLQLNFTLVLPIIHFFVGSSFNLSLADALDIIGEGNIAANFSEFSLAASAQANLTGGLSVYNVRVAFQINDAVFNIQGFNEDLSEIITGILNELAVRIINEQQELISQIISPLIEIAINAILANLLPPTTKSVPSDVITNLFLK